MRRFATNIKHTVIVIISQRGNDLLHTLSISPNVFMKLTMGASVMDDNLLRMKLDFVC